MLQALEPYYPAHNIDETAAFWRDGLGFEITGKSDSWMRAARDDVAIMFGLGTPPNSFDGVLVVRASDIDGIAGAAGVAPEWGPRSTSDNRYEVAFRDPNGYVVNFTQNVGPKEG